MDIPFDLLHSVASFHSKPRMKLLNWVDINKLNWDDLSSNPNAIHLLEANPMKINWYWLSRNPSIFEIDVKQSYTHQMKKARNIDYIS